MPPIGGELAVYARSELSAQAKAFLELMREIEWPQAPSGAVVIG